ncbi:MAG: OmpA family protein [Halomonadaceae bacterium]|nr:MAG: OmpA family protein [Halomonadaceae bacterium]
MAKTRKHPALSRPLLLPMGLLACLAVPAQGITFSAGLENSQWYEAGSIFECSLTHRIPGYGNAVFYQRAGEPLSFYLDPVHNSMRPGRAALVIEAPQWRGGQSVTDLGYVDVKDQGHPIEVTTAHSENMLASLGQGMAPTFTRRARHSDEPVRVRLTNINFTPRYQQFRQCTQGLLPVNFHQVERTRLLYPLNQEGLSNSGKRALDQVALYIRADDRVKAVYVDGHTDSLGRRIHNRALSRERAQEVTAYLVSQGVPEEMISTRYHGERYPVAGKPGNHPENRRTTVRLERLGDDGQMTSAGANITD